MKKTILVVDDFVSIRDYICEALHRKGYSTVGASNGNEAFKLLTEKRINIDLVLTDYNMPHCTGFELLRKIKADNETAMIPVIFLTTESNPDKMKNAKEAGLSSWIKKPYRSETFFSLIENAIQNVQ